MVCNPELIRTAYRLVGNHSRNYIDLRFITEPTEDRKDHVIKDIFECNFMWCHQPKDWYGMQYMIWFDDDEKPGFYLSPDEVIHTELALLAEEEIFSAEQLDLDDILFWQKKYQATFDLYRKKRVCIGVEIFAGILFMPPLKVLRNTFFSLKIGKNLCSSKCGDKGWNYQRRC